MNDVVFIIIDAARPDGIGHFPDSENETPTVDKLAEDGMSFQKAYSCINTTDPSLTSIYSGNYPSTTGLVHHGKKVTSKDVSNLKKFPFIQEVLKSNGYSTGAVDWLGRWHRRGFDSYTGVEGIHDYNGSEESISANIADFVNARRELIPRPIYNLMKKTYRKFVNPIGDKDTVENAEATTDMSLEMLEKLESPRYLLVHYWDAHAPYNTPERYKKSATVPELNYTEDEIKNKVEEIQNDDRRHYIKEIINKGIKPALEEYYGALRYIDDQIGRLIKQLPDDTYVVVMADHGESLVEHGIFFEHHGLYEVNTRIPLIFNGPNIPRKKTEGFVQLCDVMPTILGRMNLDTPNVDGIDIFSRIEEEKSLRDEIFIEEAQTQRKYAIRNDEYKYIYTVGDGVCSYCETTHGNKRELYNINKDPNELKNIFHKETEIAKKLESKLKLFFQDDKHEKDRIKNAINNLKSSKIGI